MYRREFLRTSAALAVSASAFRLRPDELRADEPAGRSVMTVTGRVDADELGPTLPHEHVSIDRHLELVQNMRQHGLLDRVLLSHDAGWYSVGEPDGGKFRPYTTLFQQFLPALKKADFSDEEIQLLTVKNPAQAFAIHVRSR